MRAPYPEEVIGSVLAPRGRFDLAACAGDLQDWSVIRKFGRNPAATTADDDVWAGGGALTLTDAATVYLIDSTHASDSGAGEGAQAVTVRGLDADWNEQSEIVTLAGTTGTITANTYRRVNRMSVNTAGGSLSAAGTITANIGAAIHAMIPLGDNQTQQAVWTVPLNKRAYLSQAILSSGVASKQGKFKLQSRTPGGVWTVKATFDVAAGTLVTDWAGAQVFPEKTDIKITCAASASTIDVSAEFTAFYREEAQ